MIMQRKSDGTYEQIGFIKSKNGDEIGTIVDASGDVYFTRGLDLEASGEPPLVINAIGKELKGYQIYGNSIQDGTPTPENPIEVLSVGDKTANLFNENDVTYGYWITDTGDVSNVVISARYNRDIAVITGKTICVRAYGERPFNIAIGYYDADNAFVLRVTSMSGSLVSTPPANAAYGVVYVASDKIQSTVPITPEKLASYKIMLTYGDSTAYEPYGYKLPVVVTGKNLFDKANTQWTNGYYLSETGELVASSSWRTTDYIPVRGMVFTINNQIGNSPCICLYDANKNLIASQSYAGKKVTTVTANEMAHYCRFSFYTEGGVSSDTLQLELGTESTEYEPYHESITTNIYLDEPLRKIGDYADIIDFERGVVERNIKKVVFDGSEEFNNQNSIYDSEIKTMLCNTEFIDALKGNYILSSHFTKIYNAQNAQAKPGTFSKNLLEKYKNYTYYNISNKELNVVQSDSTITKVSAFRSYLSKQYDVGTPVTAYYALADPTTEPISLPSIPTFDGTTVISTDTEIQPSNMEIKFKARK